MTDLALCAICAADEPQPVICRRCEDRIRRDLDNIGAMRKRLHDWCEIDPGTPCRDDQHRLALLDNPILTASGQPDLTVIAATDRRSRRIIAGWHDTECQAGCNQDDQPCTDPAHRADASDDVVNVDQELVTEARLIAEQRHLSAPIADVHDAIRILKMSQDWTVRCDRVDEHAAIMHSCAVALHAILRDTKDRIIGLCTAAHPDRDQCGGPLRLAWLGPLPLTVEDQVSPTHVQCSWCRDLWRIEPGELIGMLRATKPKGFPVRVAYIAEHLGIPERTIQHWAHTGKIRRYQRGEVDLGDVLTLRDTTTPDTHRHTDNSDGERLMSSRCATLRFSGVPLCPPQASI